MTTLTLEIVTPEAVTYSDQVDSVVVPGAEGELGILPQHVPLMTLLEPGELRISKAGKDLRLAVGEGFVQITGEKVSVLTDMAVREADIDESAAEAAVRRAEEAIRANQMGREELATVEAALQKSLAQLRVKRRRPI